MTGMFGPVPILRQTRRGNSLAAIFFERTDLFVAEYTNVSLHLIAANGNAVFNETPSSGSNCIVHREGSGIVTLRGITNQCRARYLVIFNGNIAVPTGGTVGPISIAIAVEGEALGSATATVTPAAVSDEFNVSAFAYVDVPRGCCATVSIKNINTQTIELENANLIVTRQC